ncbi:hypothetical protein CEXT_455581 [Caerostris extrusa]|uniref:Uncharacterized protein n=1 Tax=Caerostris extrusa TaxID=172846 RepID=A0AAV4Y204_CAEEX|nr:hypothetical protein CEXT_455581 [Caerostris extrusa]
MGAIIAAQNLHVTSAETPTTSKCHITGVIESPCINCGKQDHLAPWRSCSMFSNTSRKPSTGTDLPPKRPFNSNPFHFRQRTQDLKLLPPSLLVNSSNSVPCKRYPTLNITMHLYLPCFETCKTGVKALRGQDTLHRETFEP